MNERQIIRPFWILLALLMMLDGLTTYLVLTEVGHGKEGNPLAVWVIGHIGLAGMCAAKVLIGTLMAWRLAVIADRGHKFKWLNRMNFHPWRPSADSTVKKHAVWALAFSLFIMGVVVGNNTRAMLQVYGVGS